LNQTGWSGTEFTLKNWREHIAERLSEFDWDKIVADVKPFIEKQSNLHLLTHENLIKLLNDSAR
jgi:hypothetical protein